VGQLTRKGGCVVKVDLAIEFRFDLNSIAVVTTPLFANGTWIMMLPSLTIGSTLIVMPQFDPKEFLRLLSLFT